jgi:hypothetical protein
MGRLFVLAVALVALAGCDAVGVLGAPRPGETGLEGVVVRGPVQPACQQGQPCGDEPFAAGFTVRRGGRTVGTFRSDTAGRFAVRLDAGAYTVVPDDDAPLLSPASQARAVEVLAGDVTTVALSFDTGIR